MAMLVLRIQKSQTLSAMDPNFLFLSSLSEFQSIFLIDYTITTGSIPLYPFSLFNFENFGGFRYLGICLVSQRGGPHGQVL